MILSKQYLNELVQKKHISGHRDFTQIKKSNEYDIFLSYSIHDKAYAIKTFNLLIKCGYSVYIDLMDKRMNRNNVNRKTAILLADVMGKCKGLLYLHSSASKVSKWCPWELGFVSGKRKFMCGTIPLVESSDEKYTGQEYLNIYKKIDYAKNNNNNTYNFWVNDDNNCYTTLRQWLDGKWDEKKRGCKK